MSEPTQKPVIFLAFANDKENIRRNLGSITSERNGIRDALKQVQTDGLCEVVVEPDVSIDRIFDRFQEHQKRIAVFHYGGHAGSYELLLESETGKHEVAHAEGLVPFLAKQTGLQLVFLNGCCSQKQALELRDAGLPAVIGTSQNINDEVATDLSIRFYKGLAAGLSIDSAWEAAVDEVTTRKGTANYRDLWGEDDMEEKEERFPWDIYYRPGAEIVKEWNLPAAAKNPLFGLPEISEEYYRRLPEMPFLGLQYFKKEHAAIFFGRGAEIRKLYNDITGKQSIILFYGKSGVGKSSLLDAGLAPRLEKDYTVKYIRRIQEKGLTGTLMQALQEVSAERGLPDWGSGEKNEIRVRKEELEKALADATPVVRQLLEAELQKLNAVSAETQTLLGRWRLIEEKADQRRLIIILDQVEETFTRPMPKKDDAAAEDLTVFLETLRDIFEQQDKRPRGKIILSYREEHHPKIMAAFKQLYLSYADLFFQHLDRDGIIEAVEGLTRHPDTQKKYRLEIEKTTQGNLAEIIADDLLKDSDSPIATVLQILLTKLWKVAVDATPNSLAAARKFAVAQYQLFNDEGISLGEFFVQQMQELRRWQPEVVDSGLALDLLYFHTTDLSTARSRSLEELRETYQHRQEIMDQLIGKFDDLYLLTKVQIQQKDAPPLPGISLAHDTLAPIVNKAYDNSDKPGQRAARVLSSKLTDFKDNPKNVWLDKTDLAVVEKGKNSMRQLTDLEQKLLTISQKRQRRNRMRVYALVVVFIMFAVFGYWAMRSIAEKNEKLKYSDDAVKQRLQELGYYDWKKNPNGKGIENEFELQKDSLVVYDGATKLYWQRSGSDEEMNYDQALAYVDSLNRVKFVGYTNWRLPMLEEAMSLMEPEKKNGELYIDPMFDYGQRWIWTASKQSASVVWVAYFNKGYCYSIDVAYKWQDYVRAVRVGK